MNIQIRTATLADGESILKIMEAAHGAMENPSAYITDDLAYIREHITTRGFGLMAEVDGYPAGFFVVATPGLDKNNLGYHLNFSEKQLKQTALMDTAAVLPAYQGMGIMGMMFARAVEQAAQSYPYLLGTVHPENTPSRRNFEKQGFTIQKELVKPNGSQRLLMGRFLRQLNPGKGTENA